MLLLNLSPSIPSWINVVTVVALAGITWWYARSAKRQAQAAESQARAATKQAEVAERNLDILRAQIEARAGTALVTLQANVTEVKEAVNGWVSRFAQWGQLTGQNAVDLLPGEWAASLEGARMISPPLHQELLDLQRSCRGTSRLIDQFTAKNVSYRSPEEAKVIIDSLLRIVRACDVVSKKLTGLVLPPSAGH